jgi:hypothetical protein
LWEEANLAAAQALGLPNVVFSPESLHTLRDVPAHASVDLRLSLNGDFFHNLNKDDKKICEFNLVSPVQDTAFDGDPTVLEHRAASAVRESPQICCSNRLGVDEFERDNPVITSAPRHGVAATQIWGSLVEMERRMQHRASQRHEASGRGYEAQLGGTCSLYRRTDEFELARRVSIDSQPPWSGASNTRAAAAIGSPRRKTEPQIEHQTGGKDHQSVKETGADFDSSQDSVASVEKGRTPMGFSIFSDHSDVDSDA